MDFYNRNPENPNHYIIQDLNTGTTKECKIIRNEGRTEPPYEEGTPLNALKLNEAIRPGNEARTILDTVHNPTNGGKASLSNVINDIWSYISGAPTAKEYQLLGLYRDEFCELGLTALEYDLRGKETINKKLSIGG